MTNIKLCFISLSGVTGALLSNMFGVWSNDMTTLMLFMGIDFVLGLLIAGLWKKSNKSVSGTLNYLSAWKGLIKKGCSLLVILVAYRLDLCLNLNYIKSCVVFAFIASESISIIENLGIIGVPMPKVVIKAIEVLKEREV